MRILFHTFLNCPFLGHRVYKTVLSWDTMYTKLSFLGTPCIQNCPFLGHRYTKLDLEPRNCIFKLAMRPLCVQFLPSSNESIIWESVQSVSQAKPSPIQICYILDIRTFHHMVLWQYTEFRR